MEIKRTPPIISQITAELHNRISSGTYPPGSKMPSESELSRELNVSRASIREALAELDARGLLWRKHGVGTFVMDRGTALSSRLPAFFSLKEYIVQAGYQDSLQIRPPVFQPLAAAEKERLKDERDGEMVVLYRAYCADGVPVFICEYSFPSYQLNLDAGDVDYTLDIPEFCAAYLNDTVSAIQIRVEPVIAGDELVKQMELESGAPILKLQNTFFGRSGTPVFLSSLYYNSQKIDFFAFYQID